MLQQTSRTLADPDFGTHRAGMLTLEGMSLLVLGALAMWGLAAGASRLEQFVGWIYAFTGGLRLLSGAVHRGPGLAWMLAGAALALAAGLTLVLRLVAGPGALGVVLAVYLMAEAVGALGLAAAAGARLACGRWLAWVVVCDFLLAAVAVMAEGDGPSAVLMLVAALDLWLAGVTLIALAHRWEAACEPVLSRPRRTGSRTYGRPWSRQWRRE